MKVYLAGKMDEEYGSWRDALLEDYSYDRKAQRHPKWRLTADLEDRTWDGERVSTPWPTKPNAMVLGIHEYVGPYRTDVPAQGDWRDLGEFHGSTVQGSHGQSNGAEDPLIVQECLRALKRADFVFAYINRPDCFGTLVEIGVAKEAGAYVAVAVEEAATWDWSDYWFVERVADATIRVAPPVEIGPEPPYPPTTGLLPHEREALWSERYAWCDRRDREADRIRAALKDAIVAWTSRTPVQAPVSLVPHDDSQRLLAALTEAANSFAQIGRWSADPRVRDEAQRMLRRIAG